MKTKNNSEKNINSGKFYLPFEFRIYSHIMIIAAAVFFYIVFNKTGFSNLNWNIIIPLSFLAFIFLLRPFLILSDDISYYLDDIPIYASIFILGVPGTLWVVLISFTLFEIFKLIIKSFKGNNTNFENIYLGYCNTSHIMISSGIAALIFTLINKNYPLNASIINIAAMSAASFVKFFLNTSESTFSTYLFKSENSFTDIWKKNFSGIWVHLLMLAPLGFIFAYLISNNPFLSVFLAIPIMILYYACEAFKKTLVQTNKIFQTLVKSIDRRDHYTFGHSQRVAAYSKAAAKEMRLPLNQIIMAERAGKIHDIGKIALSDDILQKAGTLSEEEFLKMRAHPSISLTIFKNLHNLKKYIPAELASMHHERYDGSGYALGLKGDNIPVISRILAASDAFDAMTSERVYRKKISFKEAIDQMQMSTETQLDPRVVASFINLYKKGILEDIKSQWETSEKIYKKITKSEELEEKFLSLKQMFN